MSKEEFLNKEVGKLVYSVILVDEELSQEEIENEVLGFLEEVYEQAHQDGYDLGYNEGHNDGWNEGIEAAEDI
jgi:flagellar biosynthesis/type III secretory pathway protein FliH